MPPRRRAFTTIELLAAIAIIIILGGILLYAVSAVLRTARANATKVTLENAVGMLNEYEQFAKLNIQNKPSQWYFGNALIDSTATNWNVLDFWHVPEVTGIAPAPLVPSALPPSASVRDGEPGRDAVDPATTLTSNDAVANTVIAFQKFQTVSGVRDMMAKIAADKVYIVKNTTLQTLLNRNPLPPILLDAWNNPIIFVPSSGLTVIINKNDPANRRNVVITSPDKRPFFASAGADGDFNSSTDSTDNVYSFEK